MITVYTDGGARGNPGPAAIGVVITYNKETTQLSKTIGPATNNVAEYEAILTAWKFLTGEGKGKEWATEPIHFFLDSQLVARQLSGEYKIKDSTLQIKARSIKILQHTWKGSVSYTHIPREKNMLADKLVNLALDSSPENDRKFTR